MITKTTFTKKLIFLIGATLLLINSLIVYVSDNVSAAELANRSITLSSDQASLAGITYDLSFDVANGYNLGSIAVQFCQESPLINQACTKPLGFDATTVQLSSQSGETGFTVNANSSDNRVVIGRTPSLTSGGNLNYSFSNITNPSVEGEFYARLYLYSSNDGTGAADYFGGIALSINAPISINTVVPPYLLFCSAITISGYDCSTGTNYYIDFGDLSTSITKTAISQFVLATNADYGLNVYIYGDTLTAGNNIINQLIAQHSSLTGVAQFGLNLRQNTNPAIGQDPVGLGTFTISNNYNIPNEFQFVSGDAVVSASGPVDYEKFTSSYIVNIDNTNPPGIYSTTVVYICLANF